jgi:tyrosinase
MLQSFVEQQRNLHDHIDMAFRKSSFNSFGTTVEEAHGWVHGVIGGGWTGESPPGHMWPLEYSAFEPIFMLHHRYVSLRL